MNPRAIRMCVLCLTGILPAGADPSLSKQMLLHLYQEGVSVRALIPRIEAGGVSFPLDQAARQELTEGGVPSEVLAAIAASGQPRAARSPEEELSAEPAKILSFYRAGLMPEAFASIKQGLKARPGDVWLNCALGEAALSLRQPFDAQEAIARLTATGKPDADACAASLSGALAVQTEENRVGMTLLAKLRAGDEQAARAVIDASPFAPVQQAVLHHYVDRAFANFVAARTRLQKINTLVGDSDRALVTQLGGESDREFRAYRDLMVRARKYVLSTFAMSACTPEVAREWSVKHGLYLDEYLEVARILVQSYPDHPLTREVQVHALLLTAPYAAVKEYGADALARGGRLRIPFYSQTRPFWVVIDGASHRLFTEDIPGYATNEGVTDGLVASEPFALDFGQIAGVRQQIGVDLNNLRLSPKTEVLRLGRAGMAPYPAFLHFIYCLYGEKAVREYAWKTTKLIGELAGLEPGKIMLPDPGDRSRNWMNIASEITSYTAMGASVAIEGLSRRNAPNAMPDASAQLASRTLMEAANALLEANANARLVRETAAGFQDSDWRNLQARLTNRALSSIYFIRAGSRLAALERLLHQAPATDEK